MQTETAANSVSFGGQLVLRKPDQDALWIPFKVSIVKYRLRSLHRNLRVEYRQLQKLARAMDRVPKRAC